MSYQFTWPNQISDDTLRDIQSSLILTHRGRVTHKFVNKLAIIGSDNGLSPGRRQAIIWTKAILFIRTAWTKLSKIHKFQFKKMHLKMSFAKWWQFCLGLNVLKHRLFSTNKPPIWLGGVIALHHPQLRRRIEYVNDAVVDLIQTSHSLTGLENRNQLESIRNMWSASLTSWC